MFTLANLSTVWVEANVHENDFDMLSGTRGGQVRFHSPAYPDRVFDGEVTYTGDLVEEKSRTVKLLARAENPDRMLKPGMFVEIKILNRETRPTVQIPSSAFLSDGERAFVYVKTGPEHFERREVMTADAEQGLVTVNSGLTAGEEVVTEGAYKLKAKATPRGERGLSDALPESTWSHSALSMQSEGGRRDPRRARFGCPFRSSVSFGARSPRGFRRPQRRARMEPGVQRRQDHQLQQDARRQSADDDRRQRPLHLRPGPLRERHGDESEAGDQAGHQDRAAAATSTPRAPPRAPACPAR